MWDFPLILEGHIHLVHPVVVTFPSVFLAPALKCYGKNYALVLLLARWIETRVLRSAWQTPLLLVATLPAWLKGTDTNA